MISLQGHTDSVYIVKSVQLTCCFDIVKHLDYSKKTENITFSLISIQYVVLREQYFVIWSQ